MGMKRTFVVYVVLAAGAAFMGAQKANSPYTGTSNPPPDDSITTPDAQATPDAKPSPSHLMATQPAAQPAPG